jgi:hypothetical protein
LLRRLSDVAECLSHGTARPERLLTELADVPDRVIDRVDEALQDLRITVESRQRTIEDVVEILETHLQPRLCFHAFDVDLDLAEVHVDASDHLQQVRQLRTQRKMSVELLDVDVDLVDLHLLDVDEDVWIVARLTPFELSRIHAARLARAGRRAGAVRSASVPTARPARAAILLRALSRHLPSFRS